MTKITDYEYRFLKGDWQAPFGAAYNACHEYCRGSGLVDRQGSPTLLGILAIKEYEDNVKTETYGERLDRQNSS